MVIIKDDVQAWLSLKTTKAFFERIADMMSSYDRHTHMKLNRNESDQALIANNSMSILKDVLDLPYRIMEELEEDGNTEDA